MGAWRERSKVAACVETFSCSFPYRDYCEGLRDSFDLVPFGGWHGNGRKAGWTLHLSTLSQFSGFRDYCEGLRDSLDLVPIGGWHGNGRKGGWISPFLLAAWDPESETFTSVCRCMSGFTDAFYAEVSLLSCLSLAKGSLEFDLDSPRSDVWRLPSPYAAACPASPTSSIPRRPSNRGLIAQGHKKEIIASGAGAGDRKFALLCRCHKSCVPPVVQSFAHVCTQPQGLHLLP